MINLKLAEQLSFNYKNAHPFPHVIIDNFLENKFARIAVDELRNFQMWDHDPTDYSSDVQQNKFFCPGVDAHLEMMKKDTVMTYQILHFLNSDITLKYLEKLTGIKGLLPDPKFIGGGYHKIKRGGKLAVHADYNLHPETKLHRRINLLVYLNLEWQEEWGGHLEFWNKSLTKKTHNITPIFNRVVIFNITDDAYHGHPQPLNCPEDQARYSLALYYFTEERPEDEKNSEHSALWFFPEQDINNELLDDIFELTNE